ncbi:hypothetical protein JX265_005892 [Neoarthrinium moseri]|uniref:Uncharacterized protein n=1 Tax=Neoarthrinium moseri TaxID=1658444 RepID=A0A9Q0AR58_9PEZI|nr:uncharacterized protein JN550_002140 [Neoarthrinium moseri]KAI1871906.1 hypothetical protein JX265_005892 [Neoarthrinium moseri]KAI1875854.1 hypothetical protein JN550_002140 [Neoarthrinium moseri]
MNSFANTSGLYNHSEPILPTPSPGTCSLLTGLERENITANIFQPCCSKASPSGFEHSKCTCDGNSCETCIVQHAEEFKLISAQCNTNTSAARGRTNPSMFAIVFVVLCLALQASGFSIPT